METRDLCPAAVLAAECERRFQQNLRALSAVAPEVVPLVKARPLIITYLTRARDGSIACRLETASLERTWVGETVIPRWAAQEMLATVDLPQEGPLFLAPLDGGYGLDALLEATPADQPIIVLERDLDLFAGTLMVTDISAAAESGRVTFLAGWDLHRRIAEALRDSPWWPAEERLVTTTTVAETAAFYRNELARARHLLPGRETPETGQAA